MASLRLLEKITTAYDAADWSLMIAKSTNREPNPRTIERLKKALELKALVKEGWSDRRIREWCETNDCMYII